jgi:hypothetical protein
MQINEVDKQVTGMMGRRQERDHRLVVRSEVEKGETLKANNRFQKSMLLKSRCQDHPPVMQVERESTQDGWSPANR